MPGFEQGPQNGMQGIVLREGIHAVQKVCLAYLANVWRAVIALVGFVQGGFPDRTPFFKGSTVEVLVSEQAGEFAGQRKLVHLFCPAGKFAHKTAGCQYRSTFQAGNGVGCQTDTFKIERDPLSPVDILRIFKIKPLFASFFGKLLSAGIDVFWFFETGADTGMDKLQPMIAVVQDILMLTEIMPDKRVLS